VYALFGGKPALLAAVYAEAIRRLHTHLAALPATGDPAAGLVRPGWPTGTPHRPARTCTR